MSTNIFYKIIINELKPLLSASGYNLKAQTFVSERADIFLLVSIQKSVKSDKSILVTTINLGVYSKILAEKLEDKIATSSIWDCHLQERLGHLSGERNDKWWEIHTESEAAAAGQEMRLLLENYGLPYLEQISSTKRLQHLWELELSPGLTDGQRLRYLDLLKT